MDSTFYFIVEVKDSYNNYTKLENGLEIMVNNTIDSVEHINRIGKVLSSPKGVKAEKGDMLLFHHNICRDSWGFKGKSRKSMFIIKPNIYFIPVPEVFMIKKSDSDRWVSVDPYVFVEPVGADVVVLDNGLEMTENEYKGMNECIGKISFINRELSEEGLKEGDLITFEEYSQHEYDIDGKLYYKMKTSDILGVVK